MRAQTALEFMLIMGAVVGLATVAIGIDLSIQKGSAMSIKNILESTTTITGNVESAALPDFYLYAPSAFRIGSVGSVMLIVSWPGNFTVEGLNMSADNATVISQDVRNRSSNGTYMEYFEVAPTRQGLVRLRVRGIMRYANTSQNFSESTVSFAAYPLHSNGTALLSATIAQHNASGWFESTPVESVYTISTSTHCAYTDWEGQLYKIIGQCGAGASWYYYVGSSECYYGAGSQYRAYCLYKSGIGTVYRTDKNGTYSYNITLLLKDNQTLLRSNLSDTESTNNIYSENGGIYGNATVSGRIFGGVAAPNYTIENAGGTYAPVSQKDYGTFESYLNDTLSTLAYYNGSRISPASSDIASEQIGKYNSEAESLLSDNAGKNNCTIVGSQPGPEYICRLNETLSFSNITAYLARYYGNETVDYGKSVINIR